MKCNYCGEGIEKKWDFCPKCGNNSKADVFSDIFEKVTHEFKEMSRMFERDLEALDISPWFDQRERPKRSGFTIKIMSSGSRQPKVSVRSFGSVNEENLKKRVYNEMGIENPQNEYMEDKKKARPTPISTEEPKTEVKRLGNIVVVNLDLPGVKEDDIDIKELESSVEVKGFVDKKAYFKIITKPENSRITGKKFSDGKLSLEFS